MKNKLLLTAITFITALCISAVAIYYSVAGLAAIFAAAVIPIVIMGGVLEIAKLVTTVWLHRYWDQARWWLKTYLSIAVLVLMFITSMGIFGFLSKAHIEQTSAAQESVAGAERFNNEITRQTGLIERYETRIKQLESGGGGADASIQSQIDTEQKRIDTAYARIQPQIDEQNKIIEGQSRLFTEQITKIDSELALLQKYIDDKEVAKAQALVGVRTDGDWGPGTARAVTTWKTLKANERAQLVTRIQDINKDNSNIQAAREEVKRLRASVDVQVAESNKTIVRLRESLGKNSGDDIDRQLKEQTALLKEAQSTLDTATKEKYKIESEYRKLEAEVGPIKYIAEFIYGEDADKNMLEHAVRWVIIIIIFVFDPLAVLLLLASQYSFEYHRRERKTLDDLLKETPDDGAAMNIRPPEDIHGVTTRPFTEEEIAALDGKILDSDKSSEPRPPTIFDQYVLTELNKTLSQELEERREVEESLIKMYEDEERDNAALHDKIEQLEQELKTIQTERDRLSAAYGHEMDRADTLATLLVQEQSRVVPAVEVAVSEPEPVEPAPPQPVEITADSNINIVSVDSIQTIGVTKEAELYHPSEEYIKYKGKFMSMDALRSMRPDLILKATDPVNRIMFGNKFPDFAKSGDIYIRTDVLPNTVYKFNDSNWIVIDKAHSTTYLQYTPYVQYLIQKIESGEYDTDLLTDDERDEIERHLSTK
jgi:hypothetical protein